jgi:hypothetical protein
VNTRSRLLLLSLWATAVGQGPPAGADHQAGRQELEAVYAQYLYALQQKDSTALRQWSKRYLAPHFVQRSLTGKQERRPQWLADQPCRQAAWRAARAVSGAISELPLKEKRAIVVFTGRDTCIIRDPEGRPHRITTISHSRDTWIKLPTGWKRSRTEALRGKRLRDGKPIAGLQAVRQPARKAGAAG